MSSDELSNLLSQRKSLRSAITKTYKQLSLHGRIPSLEYVSTLQSDYEETMSDLENLGYEDDSDHEEKINLIIKFVQLYQSVETRLLQGISSIQIKNQCQIAIDGLNKLVEELPGTISLLYELQAKLNAVDIGTHNPLGSINTTPVNERRHEVPDVSRSNSPIIRDIPFDAVSRTTDMHPSFNAPIYNGFGGDNGPIINTFSSRDHGQLHLNAPVSPLIRLSNPHSHQVHSNYHDHHQQPEPAIMNNAYDPYQQHQSQITNNNPYHVHPNNNPYHVHPNNNPNHAYPYNNPNHVYPNNNSRIKVKAEEIPKFDGSAENWPDFKDAILELVINNVEIPSQSSKFRRLMNVLPIQAQARIRGQNSNPNFQQILNILDTFYGSPALVLKELTQKIHSLPFLRFDSPSSIYTKYHEMMVIIKGIRLNEGDSRTIIGHILGKMDLDNRRRAFQNLNSSVSPHTITLDHLENYFSTITATDLLINQVANIGFNRYQQSNDYKFNNKNNRQTDQKKSLLATTSNSDSSSNNKPKCIFCDQYHYHIQCPVPYDEKILVLNREKRCYRCAGKGHGTRECIKHFKCNKCSGNHQSYLCRNLSSNNQQPSNQHSNRQPSNQTIPKTLIASEEQPCTSSSISNDASVISALANSGGVSQYLQTLTTNINDIKTRVIFDSGSEISFISNKLVNKLNLPKFKNEPIRVNGYGGQRGRYIGHYYTILSIPDRDGVMNEFKLIVDDTVTQFKFNVIPLAVRNHINEMLKINFNDEDIQVDILFGNNDKNRLKILVADQQYNNSLIVGKTSLGYIVHGQSGNHRSNIVACLTENHDPPIDLMINPEDLHAMRQFIDNFVKKNIMYDSENRIYRIKFPFINNHVINPNFNNAKRLLISKTSSLSEIEYNDYNNLIKELENNKIVESCDIQSNEGYHMPHSVVCRKESSEKTTTKKRLVFNASNGNNNLNQAIFKGVTTWCLPRSLLQFRLKQIAIVADIKAAFHNIRIQPDHQKYVKFLWRDKEKEKVLCYKFLRLPFGLTSSPFVLNVVINHHIGKYKDKFPAIVSAIHSNLYVDDLVHSVNNENEAIEFQSISSTIFKEASMELRKWQCSHPDIDKSWSDGLGEDKVLGMIWNKKEDTVQISFPIIQFSSDITKRSLLTTLASIYDPMGLILPSSIKLKFFISELWERKIEWDDLLSPQLHRRANKILIDLHKLKNFQLPRKLFNMISTEYDLIIFCDSSNKAIGVAVYLSNGVEAKYIFGKSKMLKPRKIVTGELLALSAGANLADALKSMIIINKTILVSDSKANVDRLSTDINKFPQCVATHLYNIRAKIDAIHWIAGVQNPSDTFTRGISSEQLSDKHNLDRQTLQRNSSNYEQVKIGDRVPVRDHYRNREKWPVGEVVETIPDDRGIIRTYRIRIGNDKITRCNRDIFPLEEGSVCSQNITLRSL